MALHRSPTVILREAKDLKMRRLRILRSFAVCAAQDDEVEDSTVSAC
jgi:hypothetical protein